MIRSILSTPKSIIVILFAFLLASTTDAFTPCSPIHRATAVGHVVKVGVVGGTFASTPSPSQSVIMYMSDEGTDTLNVGDDSVGTPPPVKCPDCDLCDGSGRILGGIPTILPWWPIKPYRPCPNFIANGGKYSRIGQPLDEIAFGRGNIDTEDDDF